jgi:hypothetical protein
MNKLLNTAFLLLISAFTVFSQAQFSDVTEAAGLTRIGKNHGVAVADFNNDGWDDIFAFCREAPCQMYKNNGDGTFTDVAKDAGVNHTGTPSACVWADINNDGWLDLFVGNRDENNLLYINNGNGTFNNIAGSAGVMMGNKVKAALFADVDRDGLIDLYLARLTADNILYRNIGNSTFSNFTLPSGATNLNISMGAVFLDYDNDSDLDLYLTHDANRPFILYQNNGSGHFTDVSAQSGANIAAMGMGVDFGDVNNDGWLDLYITNLLDNALLLNNGNGTFTNSAVSAGVNDYGMGWGCSFLDFDNDGWQDLYIANDSYFSPYPNLLYHNTGNNTFQVVSQGTPLHSMQAGYGIASLDYDDDGKLDIYLANTGGSVGNQLFKNEMPDDYNWVKIKATGTVSNRAAIGTRVTVEAGGMKLIDEIAGGSGYASQNSLTLHFGLAQATVIDKLTIRWPNGLTEEFTEMDVNETYHFIEGQGIATETKFVEETSFKFKSVTPNPFSGNVDFTFQIDRLEEVTINLFDLSGRLARTIFDGTLPPGIQKVSWDGSLLPKGIYFARIQTSGSSFSIKLAK